MTGSKDRPGLGKPIRTILTGMAPRRKESFTAVSSGVYCWLALDEEAEGKLLKIEKVESFIVDLPTIRPHVLSMATMRVQSCVIVRIFCSDGVVGYGEATTIGGLSYGEESPEGIKLTIDRYFEPLLRTADPSFPSATMKLIKQNVVHNHFAKAAVEMALLDSVGKRLGLPISELLGGRQRDSLPIAWTLASGDTDQDIDEAVA